MIYVHRTEYLSLRGGVDCANGSEKGGCKECKCHGKTGVGGKRRVDLKLEGLVSDDALKYDVQSLDAC